MLRDVIIFCVAKFFITNNTTHLQEFEISENENYRFSFNFISLSAKKEISFGCFFSARKNTASFFPLNAADDLRVRKEGKSVCIGVEMFHVHAAPLYYRSWNNLIRCKRGMMKRTRFGNEQNTELRGRENEKAKQHFPKMIFASTPAHRHPEKHQRGGKSTESIYWISP